MSQGTFSNQWPGENEQAVVEEMLRDGNSVEWAHCHEYVRQRIEETNYPRYNKEEAVQQTMLAVYTELPNFRFQGKFTHWLAHIARSKLIDLYRKERKEKGRFLPPGPPSEEDSDYEISEGKKHRPDVVLEHILAYEYRHSFNNLLNSFVAQCRHPDRDAKIIQKVLVEGRRQKAIAKELGISAPMVGYVINQFKKYYLENKDREL